MTAVSCARQAGQPEESAVRQQHGRSRDEAAREGQNRSTHEEFLTIEEECVRSPQYGDGPRSTLTSISMSYLVLSTESASAHVYNQVHQKQTVCE